METQEDINSPTQCDIQAQFTTDSDFNIFHEAYDSISFRNENLKYCTVAEEPIDLTVSPSDLTYKCDNEVNITTFNNKELPNVTFKTKNFIPRLQAQPFQIVNCPEGLLLNQNQYDYCPSKRKKRRKFVYTNEGNLLLVAEDHSQAPPAVSQSKELEILKAAKSLFSKRTRTLYHWMYPTASKQQVKTTVLTSWDSLAETEKDFYISQVLGRFGLSQTNLMVNPQLGSIKEPPPPMVERVIPHTKGLELQSAISSISPGTSAGSHDNTSMTFEEFEALNERTRKRRGRPKGNQFKRVKPFHGDFQDDPELSQELEKFAIKFNLNRFS